MKILHQFLRMLLVLAVLAVCVLFLRPPMAQDPDILQDPTLPLPTQTDSVPTTGPTAPPTKPPVDTAALIHRITEQIPADEKTDAAFLNWLMERFGTDVLLNLEQSLMDYGYERSIWYRVTGNSYYVLMDLHSGKVDTDPRIQFVSQGTPAGKTPPRQ